MSCHVMCHVLSCHVVCVRTACVLEDVEKHRSKVRERRKKKRAEEDVERMRTRAHEHAPMGVVVVAETEKWSDCFFDPGVLVTSATVKLFLRHPEKSKDLVNRLLNMAAETSDNPDLRDR